MVLRLKHEPPNLIPPILCHDVIDVGVWERSCTLAKINKMAYFAREAPAYPTKVSSLSRKELEAANASVKDRSCYTCMH